MWSHKLVSKTSALRHGCILHYKQLLCCGVYRHRYNSVHRTFGTSNTSTALTHKIRCLAKKSKHSQSFTAVKNIPRQAVSNSTYMASGPSPKHADFIQEYCDNELAPITELQESVYRKAKAQKLLDDTFPWDICEVWKRKDTSGSMMESYEAPKPSPVEGVFTVQVQMTEDQAKRDIYSISDTHFGSFISRHMLVETEEFMQLLVRLSDTVHTLVLNGDIVEMWLRKFDLAPKNVDHYISERNCSQALTALVNKVHELAEHHDVNVYYVRGNHDHEMTEEDVHRLFGPKVTFIPGILLYEIKQGNEIYRIRFEHGHDFDIFNSYRLGEDPDGLICDRPFGYYVSRAAANGVKQNNRVLQKTIKQLKHFFLHVLPGMFERIGCDSFGSYVVKILSSPVIERFMVWSLLQCAHAGQLDAKQKIIIDDTGHHVNVADVLKYRIFKRTAKKFGYSLAFDMLKHTTGDFTKFTETCEEDVVCTAHNDRKDCKVLPGRKGNIIYCNSGSWHDEGREYSCVRITPPWNGNPGGHGEVEINYKLVNLDDP